MPAIDTWLAAFAAAVRARDYAAGRRLFDPGVTGFGTVERLCRGIDALEHGQWRDVWPRTSEYRIEPIACGQYDGMAWAAVAWSSLGCRDGQAYRRSGRATFVLRKAGGTWRAVHSHHSFDPDPAHRR